MSPISAKEWIEKFGECAPYQIRDEPESEWDYHISPDDLYKVMAAFANYVGQAAERQMLERLVEVIDNFWPLSSQVKKDLAKALRK